MEYLLTFFFLMAAHYVEFDHLLPWKMPSPQRIVLNYVIGTVGMLAPFGWKLWKLGEFDLLISLGGFVIAAGLAPMLAYANDGWKRLKEAARETGRREVTRKREMRGRRRSQNGSFGNDFSAAQDGITTPAEQDGSIETEHRTIKKERRR